ncbi:MAG TPA: adenosine kinase [Caulobacteraceae bacterium]|jgi:sugar/nucleoside kinase (ribokinase family)|nr:adenosine kinase [Caulobacteraceae bacterium]
MTAPTLDVVGIGNAIVDIIDDTDDAFLARHAMTKGAMALIDEDQAEAIYAAMGPAMELSGGSAGNTIAGLASLGARCGYIGKVRDDQLGHVFRHDITAAGIAFPTPSAAAGPATARCLILVTPDAQRTMNTFLGACVNLTPEDIDIEMVSSAKITYLEGYLYDPPHAQEAFRKAAAIARASERKVALSLSDSFCVHRHRTAFLELIRTVDVLFANEAELCALFETEDFEAALESARGRVPLTAATCGAKGAVIVSGDQTVRVAAAPVERVVDTTGAGDLFAAGFLHGLTQDLPLAECGRLGALAAAEIISHYGGRPQTPLSAYVAAAD